MAHVASRSEDPPRRQHRFYTLAATLGGGTHQRLEQPDRRNSKDYERKPASSAVMIQISSVNLMLNRLSPRSEPVFRYRQKALES